MLDQEMLKTMPENKTRNIPLLWILNYGVWTLFYRKWGENANFPAGGDMITVVDKHNGASNITEDCINIIEAGGKKQTNR